MPADLHSFVNTMLSKTPINKESLSDISNVWMHVVDVIDLHDRLGHASFSKLKHITYQRIQFTGNSDFECYICPEAKQTRLPFPLSITIAKRPFIFVGLVCNFAFFFLSSFGMFINL